MGYCRELNCRTWQNTKLNQSGGDVTSKYMSSKRSILFLSFSINLSKSFVNLGYGVFLAWPVVVEVIYEPLNPNWYLLSR